MKTESDLSVLAFLEPCRVPSLLLTELFSLSLVRGLLF